MKKLLLATALTIAVSGSGVQAGGYAGAAIEPEVVEVETVKSAKNDEWVLGLMFFLIFFVGLTSG